MTTIDKCLDLDLAPARRTSVTRLMDALSLPLKFFRVVRNRREIRTLENFSDHELSDIGLTRSDVRASLSGGPLYDPSDYLADAARHRRPVVRRDTW